MKPKKTPTDADYERARRTVRDMLEGRPLGPKPKPKEKPIPGQLDLDGRVVTGP